MHRLLPIALVFSLALSAGCAGAQSSSEFDLPHDVSASANSPAYPIPRMESLLRDAVNDIRRRHDLPALSHDKLLDDIARDHSADMARLNFFAHTNLDGKSPTDRGKDAGYECRLTFGDGVYTGIAENLYYTYTYESVTRTTRGDVQTYSFNWKDDQSLAREIAEGWYTSPPHRKNLLDPKAQSQGMGIVIRSDHRIYATQNLC